MWSNTLLDARVPVRAGRPEDGLESLAERAGEVRWDEPWSGWASWVQGRGEATETEGLAR